MDRRAHLALRFLGVGDDIGQGTVIADRTGEDGFDVVAHTFVHDAFAQNALLDGGAQIAGAANRVDRDHVVAMPALDGLTGVKRNAERCAEERGFDIVRGNRVSAKENLDVPRANDTGKELPSATMHDRGTGDDENFAAVRACFLHRFRDLFDHEPFGFLG